MVATPTYFEIDVDILYTTSSTKGGADPVLRLIVGNAQTFRPVRRRVGIRHFNVHVLLRAWEISLSALLPARERPSPVICFVSK